MTAPAASRKLVRRGRIPKVKASHFERQMVARRRFLEDLGEDAVPTASEAAAIRAELGTREGGDVRSVRAGAQARARSGRGRFKG